ncbi:hypothetical protein SDC9_197712 [bioreactor metagenome]|uniref:Uncharacterized protein n=1 Tax=bioreactor metagenome TaxID=1076179 RepID=A0A645IGI9_9ZZZZ
MERSIIAGVNHHPLLQQMRDRPWIPLKGADHIGGGLVRRNAFLHQLRGCGVVIPKCCLMEQPGGSAADLFRGCLFQQRLGDMDFFIIGIGDHIAVICPGEVGGAVFGLFIKQPYLFAIARIDGALACGEVLLSSQVFCIGKQKRSHLSAHRSRSARGKGQQLGGLIRHL